MSSAAAPPSPEKQPDRPGTRATPEPLTPPPVADRLDVEEDIAPNLGGEDQMQDA